MRNEIIVLSVGIEYNFLKSPFDYQVVKWLGNRIEGTTI